MQADKRQQYLTSHESKEYAEIMSVISKIAST